MHFQVKKQVSPIRLLRSKGPSAFGKKAGWILRQKEATPFGPQRQEMWLSAMCMSEPERI